MMKKCFVLLVTLLLCACSAPSLPGASSDAAASAESSPPQETGEQQAEILFLVDTGLDSAYRTAAENFAERVSERTTGELNITVRESAGAGNHFLAGRADFAFIGRDNIRARSDYLDALSMPFLYPTHTICSMVINQAGLLDILSADLSAGADTDVVFLAGYYNPGMQLISTWQPTNHLIFADSSLATGVDSASALGFSLLGTMVLEEPALSSRLQLLREGEVQAGEFTLEELGAEDWTGTNFYITYTYHDTRPLWVAAQSAVYGSLTPRQSAAVQEALAEMYGDLDQHFLTREQALEDRLRKEGVLFSRDFAAARSQIIEVLWDEETPMNAAQEYVLALVDTLK